MGEKPVRSVRTAEYDKLTRLIKELRTEANLTQRELCERLGQDLTYVSKLERGTRRLDVVELFELAQALNKDPIEIFSRLKKELTAIRTKTLVPLGIENYERLVPLSKVKLAH